MLIPISIRGTSQAALLSTINVAVIVWFFIYARQEREEVEKDKGMEAV